MTGESAAARPDWELETRAQMAAKLEAQMVLQVITEALCLSFAELGNGWKDAAPKILARIEEIVDEGGRGFRERDALSERAAELEKKLRSAYAYRETVEGLPPGTLTSKVVSVPPEVKP